MPKRSSTFFIRVLAAGSDICERSAPRVKLLLSAMLTKRVRSIKSNNISDVRHAPDSVQQYSVGLPRFTRLFLHSRLVPVADTLRKNCQEPILLRLCKGDLVIAVIYCFQLTFQDIVAQWSTRYHMGR